MPTAMPQPLVKTPLKGFTLIELLVVVAVLTILATIATPNLISLLDNRRLTGAAEAILADFQFARSEAIMSFSEITLQSPSNGDWLVVLDSANQTIRRITDDDYPRLEIAANNTWTDGILMDPVRGLAVNPANTAEIISPVSRITLTNPQGRSLEVRLNGLGRAWICQANGSGRYGACL